MSSFINKAKEKIEQTLSKDSNKDDGHHTTHTKPSSGGYGDTNTTDQYGTGASEGYGNTRTTDQYGSSGVGGTTTHNTHGTRTNDPGYDNPQSTNAGPHSSNILNKTDPRVDSDRDNRNDPTSRVGGYGTTQHTDQYGSSGVGGTTSHNTHGSRTNDPGYDNPQSTNAGPHSSNLLNKLDPRADSDRDNRNDPTSRVGGYGNTQEYGDSHGQTGGAGGFGTTDSGYGASGRTGHTGHTGHTAGHGHTTTGGVGGYTEGTGTYGDRSGNTGPHGSNLANKLDPRTSDTGNYNEPTSHTGTYGGQTETYGRNTGAHTGTHTGDRTGYAGGYDESSNTPGSGTARNTAGPHNSDLLNKVDPRVDSDADGSKTYGGNQTYR